MTPKATHAAIRNQIRDRLREIADRARSAERMSVTSDNLCDALDDIDNDLQAVIDLVKRVRDGGGA